MKAEVENNLVKACIQNLCYYGAVKVIPMFHYSNVYCVTPHVLKLREDSDLRLEFLAAAASNPDSPVTFRQAFQFVTSLKHGTSVKVNSVVND